MTPVRPDPTVAHPVSGARLVGIDLARFLAIVGMVVAHLRVIDWGSEHPLDTIVDGNPSTLFAVLGGVSVVLATRRHLEQGAPAAARWSLFARGGIVILIGLLLGLFTESPAVVVLVPFGVAMWAAIAFLRAHNGVLVAGAILLFALTPVLIGAVTSAHESGMSLEYEDQGSLTFESFAVPLDGFRRLLLTGSYPALTWLGYLLVGMLIARGLLAARDRGTHRRFAASLLVPGAVLTAIGVGVGAWASSDAGARALSEAETATLPLWQDWLGQTGWAVWVQAEPHTGTLPDAARGIGMSLIIISGCLLMSWVLPKPALMALRPVTAAGAAPLSAYTFHIVLLNVLAQLAGGDEAEFFTGDGPWWLTGPGAIALHLAGILALGTILAVLGRRGPLEAVTSWAASLAARARRGTV